MVSVSEAPKIKEQEDESEPSCEAKQIACDYRYLEHELGTEAAKLLVSLIYD